MPTVRLTDSKVGSIKHPDSGQVEYADDLVTGLRLRVGARTKTWIVRGRVGSKIINKKLGRYPDVKLTNARDKAKDVLKEAAETGEVRPARTFGELADQWIEQHAKQKNKSWKLQKRRLEIHALPHWQDRKIDTITRADVIALVDRLVDQGSDVAANRLLTLLKTLFKYAMRKGLIDANPADAIDKPGQETERDRWLTESEIKTLWKAANLIGHPFGPMVKTLLLSAQRRTEVASMKWADIDLEKGEWTLPASMTKSGRQHLVPLSPATVSILAGLPRMGAYVFTNDGESYVNGFSKYKKRLDGFMAQLDNFEDWRLHDLRRTAATHMTRLGISEFIVGKVLNHSAGQGVTARHYNLYSYAEEKRHALNVWGADVLRIVGEAPAAYNVTELRSTAND